MASYCTAQGTLLNTLWWSKWERNPKKRDYTHTYWRRQWHPTPVLLPGKSHGRRSLVGCSPWGLKKSDTTEWLHFQFSLSWTGEGNGNPLQCSCLENPRDRGAWWAAIYGVSQSRARLKRLSSSSSSIHIHITDTICCTQKKWKWTSQPSLCDPVDYNTVHEILQARILEWVAIPVSWGFSQPQNWTGVPCIAGGFFTSWAT